MKKNVFAYVLGSAVVGLLIGIVLFVLISAKDAFSFSGQLPEPTNSATQRERENSGNNNGGRENEEANETENLFNGLDLSGVISSASLGGEASQNTTVLLEILSQTEGSVYLRVKSFGNYAGNVWLSATPYSGKIDSHYSMNYLTGVALKNAGASSNNIEIVNNFDDYLLPYYLTVGEMNYHAQSSDVYYEGSTEDPYSLTVYDFGDELTFKTVSLNGAYAQEEAAYRQFVYDNYLQVPVSARLPLMAILARNGIYAGGENVVQSVSRLVRTSATYDLNYDAALDDETDVVVAFLQKYKKGICQHFASAATLLFRTLGIPARYVNGCVAHTIEGEWVQVTADMAHAWTEIYIDGLGWIKIDATPGGAGGGVGSFHEYEHEEPEDPEEPGEDPGGENEGGEQTLGALVIAPVDTYYRYDGATTFTANDQITGLSRLISAGFTYEATVSGSRMEPGVTSTEIVDFRLFDPLGEDVTDRYTINRRNGILQVYIEEITIVSGSAEKVYDGTPLTYSSIEAENDKLLPTHSITVLAANGQRTLVGTSDNGFTVAITDENGNDV
ncbi:MAG: transglutaminase domain-containing protein, partial [Clostridia bacterium]|nr:transglutaminase domain-containing protein [Clostridia bacterium]